MRGDSIRFAFLLSLMFLFLPLMTKAQMADAPAVPETLTEEEVRLFIADYTKRFTKMDLEAYMDLFSREAIENRALPYADIREAYRKTIQITQSVQYDVKIYVIQTYSKDAFVSGRYHLTQIGKGSWRRTLQGNIQWLLVREGRALKVKEVNYGITY